MNTHLKWTLNRFHTKDLAMDEALSQFNDQQIRSIYQFQQSHPSYTKTALVSLQDLAKHLGIAQLHVKDESNRFGLNAFKVMGGIYAMGNYIAQALNKDISTLSFSDLTATAVREQLGELTFISATDGNHGRGVAWTAKELGHRSVIYLPKGASQQRLQAIQAEGAEAYITDMNYDDTVRMCAQLAEKNGWVLVQDTGWEGYEEIPLWIMQGYATIVYEMIEELPEPPTHLILQAGVGSFAASIAATMMNAYPTNPPKILVVEPAAADCYFRSLTTHDGHIEHVTGDLATIMAGLSCGEPNTHAYELLKKTATASFSCVDGLAALGMRVLGNPIGNDPRIISGESGAIPMGLLYYLRTTDEGKAICDALAINNESRLLFVSTEGNTDAQHYLDVVWKGYHPSHLESY
ncbi:diaminopropionate ammonia-lyase [Sporosarcina saromensis]|uniref:Diaminopropionate ammonia-lyase n=1 Tax=Sporosarcina saromensis TaxID=359365 RepID=A0ABU4G4U9_9BACL|nr:diaminopropionate ammonia-lyase [Sporosarcina saromensis]MDW0111989.1 diaminopropionate ammonia-lyase [Sporosarcina saromensis]